MPRLAGLSIDLDDRWTYLRTRGAAAWAESPSVLSLAVPRSLEFLHRHGLRATVFVVGRDARRPEVRALLRSVVAAGHEIGNHSFSHEPWLHLRDDEHVNEEIVHAEDAIVTATAMRPVGFRGPGHSVTGAVRAILAARGYLYDASPLRTFVMPLVRKLYFRGVELTPAQRRERAKLGGTLASALGTNRASTIEVGERRLVELPVTTFPGLRLPIHFTYLQRLEQASPRLARAYFAAAIGACVAARVEPCLLLHATDFLGRDDGVEMDFFPGMKLPLPRKLALIDDCLRIVARRHRLVPLRDFARVVAGRAGSAAGRPREAVP